MEKSGFKDINGCEIMIGGKVRFKSWGKYWTIEVQKWKEGIYPFIPNISEEVGFYTEPNECVVVP